MSLIHNPSIVTNGLIMYYDMNNTMKSFVGPPTTNRVISIPLTLTVYAYASGPVSTAEILDATNQLRTVNRYTITNNINTARAMMTSSGLTTGVSYTFSCKIKYNGGNTATPSFEVNASKGNPEGGANNNTFSSNSQTTTSLSNGWYYVTYTWSYSSCPTGGCYLTYGVVTGSDAAYLTNTFDVYEPQFEIGSFATPYVAQSNGIRSSTASVLDLTNKNIITATSLTYNSDNTFTFNASSSNITSSSFTGHQSSSGTLMGWAYPTSTSGDLYLVAAGGTTTYGASRAIRINSGSWCSVNYGSSTEDWNGIVAANLNTWQHVTYAWSGTTIRFYLNGVEYTNTRSGMVTPLGSVLTIGATSWSPVYGYWPGRIGTMQVYNRALSAAEVRQNFNAHRGRYGV